MGDVARDEGKCIWHETLEGKVDGLQGQVNRMDGKLDLVQDTVTSIDTRLRNGDVKFAKIGVHMGLMEKIVYGAVGLVLIGMLTALLAVVLKGK